ncbi:MAG: LPS assembly lipoprotein LptE [Rhodospirillales bacterium]|nr:LPS assembly lipoprotein LptE [Rhodospirillales bacterium]
MSSPERPLSRFTARLRRRPASALVLVLALVVLGACAVEPLYGMRSAEGRGGGVAAIEVAPVKDRIGHIVRNHLIDGLTPRGQPANPDYRLTLSVERSKTGLLVQLDDYTTRYNLTLRATFSLTDRTGTVVYRDTARATGSFNVVGSGFATVTAEQNAAEDAARVLSEDILTLILLHLRR